MRLKFFLLTGLFMTLTLANGKVSQQLGNFVSFSQSKNKIEIKAENAFVELSSYSDEIVRVRVNKTSPERNFSYAVTKEAGSFFNKAEETNSKLIVTTASVKIEIDKNPIRISFYDKEGNLVNADDKDFGVSWLGTEVSCFKKLNEGERFLGLGEKTGHLDRRGNAYTNWNTDDYGYETDADPLYVSIPFFIGVNNKSVYGIFFDNSHKTVFDFGASTDGENYWFSAVDGEMNYYFISGKNVGKVIENYTDLTGRMKMPPMWSLGFQQCRWSYYPDTEVIRVAETFREKKIPADVIYLDINYMDGYRIFTWHPEHFSTPKETIDKLKEMGFHVVTIVDPGIKIDEKYPQFTDALEKDYFVKYPNGKNYTGTVWPGRCHFPDFTRNDARTWWGKQFHTLTVPGVEGFWNDMNEPAVWGQNIPNFVEFDNEGSKSTLRECRNVYGFNMSRATFEGTKELMNGERPFVLTRAAYAGIQRYSAVWTGDNVSEDDHMLGGVRLVNSLGLSGVSFTGPDVGGFKEAPTPDLFVRWLNIGAFTPFFRNHTEINSPQQEPWIFGDAHTVAARKIINTRYRLMPYIYSAFRESVESGLPVSRSLAIDYTFDKMIYDHRYDSEYMFGEFMLVAPVDSKTRITKVYLPKGEWYRYGSDEKIEGGKEVYADCEIDNLPVYVKAGGIITEQSEVQYTEQKSDGVLTIHVYNGSGNTVFKYYEDDGKTYEYENGIYYKRKITFDGKDKKLILDEVEGSFESRFNKVKVVLHNFNNKEISEQKLTSDKMVIDLK
ncbi:MAG: glycoside hydrolase family 31 protein [Rhodothermaceae bacterium]